MASNTAQPLFPRKCEVANGCGQLLSKTSFYRHKAKGSCRVQEDSQQQNDEGRSQQR